MRDVAIIVPPKPWTGITVKALRDEIARGGDEVFGLSYQVVYLWYSRVLLSVVEELNGLEYHRVLDENPVISFRVKTVDTLRDKLIRQDSTPLFRIHDIIGARVTANMTLQQQNELVRIIAANFPKCRISDLRYHPHTGYRAVHVICRLQRGIFVEIQVRTALQDGWANCFEAISDRYGREIRYGEFPVDEDASRVVNEMMELSRECGSLEEWLSFLFFREQSIGAESRIRCSQQTSSG
jgi:ppGpp synthetase/RelA/SpoT-type nucleotidyltranferase